jgi:hypothetical protein
MRRVIARGRIVNNALEITNQTEFLQHIKDGFSSHITISATRVKTKLPKNPVKRESTGAIEGRVDKLFSRIVRAKAHNICEIHAIAWDRKIELPFVCSHKMQCCHKFSRSYAAIKYDRRNVYCGCESGNLWAHFHEQEWHELWREIWPVCHVELLPIRKAHCHRTRQNYISMEIIFRDELKKLV